MPLSNHLRKFKHLPCAKCSEAFQECMCDPMKCRGCDQNIWFVKTKRGANMPVNKDGTCHFDTCTSADDFR